MLKLHRSTTTPALLADDFDVRVDPAPGDFVTPVARLLLARAARKREMEEALARMLQSIERSTFREFFCDRPPVQLIAPRCAPRQLTD